ncbi:Rubrerythrin [Clostridium cavendishii DSM 21758]|uniref:Rubrerythrin n=1 Tax=Clostridium cavendishii DSM 21758 TaxID=1121302 RepID=A0A1M6D4N3_9CLOT|nr:rubrerythrin family protein [Clostridium cavendishii]SHI68043.1 Rubrerythrin [Clostridium cavendishii DSM 21758]
MKNFKGTETEKNLYKTFAIEARTNNIYIMFAEKAKREGYQWVAQVFETLAGNELAHSRAAYAKYLNNIKATEENLDFSVNREEDVTKMYKEFEKIAHSEGLDELAHFFKELQETEESHVEIYSDLLDRFKNGGIFHSKKPIYWVCLNCGYVHEGISAPNDCPCCGFPQAYFKPKCDYDSIIK